MINKTEKETHKHGHNNTEGGKLFQSIEPNTRTKRLEVHRNTT